MTINPILEKAREVESQHNRIGEHYQTLSKVSLKLLVKECGGQSNAAEIIRCFYGIKKCQGTISKALQGGSSATRHELRIAIDCLLPKDYPVQVTRQVLAHLGSFPRYHDIFKCQDRYVLYADCVMVAGCCHMVVINQSGDTETVKLTDLEVV